MPCKAKTTEGTACQAPVVGNSGYCFWHAPGFREKMMKASRKGGLKRLSGLPEAEPLSAERSRAIIAAVIEAVATGALSAGVARVLGYLLLADMQIRERSDLEMRIQKLEQQQQERLVI